MFTWMTVRTHTLIQGYRGSDDIERGTPVLSSLLGHTHPADTYWHLWVHPELMGPCRWQVGAAMGGRIWKV